MTTGNRNVAHQHTLLNKHAKQQMFIKQLERVDPKDKEANAITHHIKVVQCGFDWSYS